MILTPTHLAIVMEYASGGELFERICNAGRFPEDEVCSILQLFLNLIALTSNSSVDFLTYHIFVRHVSSSSN